MADKAEWMAIGEAAKFLGVSRDTLRRWEKRGKVKPVRSPTNRRYYTKKHLEEVMAGKTEPEREEKKLVKAPSGSKPARKLNKKALVAIVGLASFLITAAIAAAVLFLLL